MKKLTLMAFLMLFVCSVGMCSIVPDSAQEAVSASNFFKDNWIELLFAVLALAEVVVRLTPTKKDDSVLNWIIKIINAILPNRKKDGGKHLI